MRSHLSRRVLAGVTSIAIGGVYVAASALTALADSPSPSSITATVTTNTNGTVAVEVHGEETWGNAACKSGKGAGYAIAWGDKLNPGNVVAQGIYVGTTLDAFGELADNVVHPASCNGTTTVFGPLSHTYASSSSLPDKVCAVAYHTTANTATGRHGFVAGGPDRNTDNSIEENGGGPTFVCIDINAPKSDVTIGKTADPTTLKAGRNVTYTIVVNNDSSVPTSHTLTVTDTLPAGVTFVSSSSDSDWSCSGTTTVTCDRTTALGGGDDSGTITIVGKTDAGVSGTIRNNAHVDNGANNAFDANPDNNDAHADIVVTAPAPDIAITKDATPSVLVGQDITYTLSVSNPSSTDATDHDIVVTDTLPDGTEYKSIAPGAGWDCPNAGQSFTCTYAGVLDPGAAAPDIIVTATALDGAVPSVINTGHVTMGTHTDQDSAKTVVNVQSPNLTLLKSAVPASGSTVSRGQQIAYTLSFANTGAGNATGVDISDVVPAHTKYVAGTAACSITCTASYDSATNTVHFALDIAALSKGTATFKVKVDADAADGTIIENVGTLTHKTTVVHSNKVQHKVFVPSGSLALVKSVDPTKAKPGTVLTYTLVATASGNITQHNVSVTDEVPADTTFKSANCASPCVASYNSTTGVVTWALGDMNPGDSRAMTFAVSVNGPDANGTLPLEIVNIGYVKSTETAKTPSNRVVVPVTAVLARKFKRTVPPATPTTLPFTGLNSLQDALLAMVLIGGGLLLVTWPRLRPQSAQEA